ncbi:hypothetical protein Leryth_004780 [Lithospermum erythrorhizon]|nr:hypothetical protein Leryth_004780 [Lithospermum erythrorhizon]
MASSTISLLSLYILFSLLTSISAFTPIDNHLINCGSPTPTTVDLFNRRFVSDAVDSPNSPLTSTQTIQLINFDQKSTSSPLYKTARAFKNPGKYTFGIEEKGTHLVRLHFARFDFGECGHFDVLFHVLANGFVLLSDFKGVQVGKSEIVKDFVIWVDSDVLEIMFVPLEKSKLAFVNAIEVISAPKDLIGDLGQFVSSEKNERVRGLMRNGYEVMHRINVGGPKVTPFNDSLWRTWIPDNDFVKSNEFSSKVVFTGRINYQPGGASREVGPDNVYSSARVIKSVNDEVIDSRLSWEFPVLEGYKYLVRMHFCDIAIGAFYADFIVDGGSAGVLTVSVGPSNKSSPHAVDGILNGIEVMKINNSMSSFDGKACVGSILKSWEGHRVGYVFPLVAAMFMLLIASVILQRRGVQLRDSVSWSPLPVDASDINMKHVNQLSSGKV